VLEQHTRKIEDTAKVFFRAINASLAYTPKLETENAKLKVRIQELEARITTDAIITRIMK